MGGTIHDMDQCPEVARISCELSRIADLLSAPDLVGAILTSAAIVVGAAVSILIAWLLFRAEFRVRRAERREDAFVRVIDAVAKFSNELWDHRHRWASLETTKDPNGYRTREQREAALRPSTAGVDHAASAARIILVDRVDRESLSNAMALIHALDASVNDRSLEAQLTVVTEALAAAVRPKT